MNNARDLSAAYRAVNVALASRTPHRSLVYPHRHKQPPALLELERFLKSSNAACSLGCCETALNIPADKSRQIDRQLLDRQSDLGGLLCCGELDAHTRLC